VLRNKCIVSGASTEYTRHVRFVIAAGDCLVSAGVNVITAALG
jgi:hypothetical protein